MASHVATLATRLAALEPTDPLKKKKALRLFIEAALLDEFGGEHIVSPEFQSIVDRTLAAIESEPTLHDTLDGALSELGLSR